MTERPQEGHAIAAGATHKPAAITTTDRVIAVGMPGSGKSELLLGLFAEDPGQRLLIDVQDAYYLGPAVLADPHGYMECNDPRALAAEGWGVRTIRYVPRRAGRAGRQEYDDLYAAIWARAQRFEELGHLTVLLDESVGPTEANYTPPYLMLALTQGRKKHLRHLAATQRPAKVAPELISTADHAFVFDVGGRRDDLDRIGERFGWNGAEVGEAIRELADHYGYMDGDRFRCHGYLRHRMGQREVIEFPPLPADVLKRTEQHVVNAT